MSVGTRTPRLAATAVLMGVLLVATPVRAEDALVFDLSATPDLTAHILWNIPTNNISRADAAGWNASYLTDSASPGGTVTIVPDTGAVTGEMTAAWACDGDCDGWSYRDALVTATIVEATIAGDGSITGSVSIEYRIAAGRNEEPSDCNGSPCWICENRFCTLATTLTGGAALSGSLDGQLLSLGFTDRLAEDAHEMDLSGLRRTEFAMARMAVEGTPVRGTPAATQPATTTNTAEKTTTTTTAAAGSDEAAVAPDAVDAPDTDSADGDRDTLSLIGLAVAILLLLSLLAPGLRSWYRDIFAKMIEWVARRSEPDPPPAPNEQDPNERTYRVGGKELTFETTVEAVPPPPPALEFEVIGSKENDYRFVEGRSSDGATVTRLYTGSKVLVITRLEHTALVRPVGGGTPIWIDRRDIRTINPKP